MPVFPILHPRMKILVTGASGLLGRAVVHECTRAGHDVKGVAFSRASDELLQVDLTDARAVQAMVQRERPDIVVNLAAERRPDVVEKNPAAARKLNVEMPGVLAKECRALDSPAYFLHISTDYVFDGRNPPYNVASEPNPLNAYGKSKREGEVVVLEAALPGAATNLRLPVLYGETEYNGESAVNVLLDAICPKDNSRVKMDAHSVRYPTNVADVARVIEQLAALYQKQMHSSSPSMPDTLHFSAQEAMTKYDMCLVMSRLWNQVCGEAVSTVDHLDPQYEADPNAGTQRPGHCKLDVSALEELGIGVKCVPFDEWWHGYFERLPHPPPLREELAEKGANTPLSDAEETEVNTELMPRATDLPKPSDQVHEEVQPDEHKGLPEEVRQNVPDERKNLVQDVEQDAQSSKAAEEDTLQSDEEERYGLRTPSEQEGEGGTFRESSAQGQAAESEHNVTFSVRVGDPQRVGDPVTAHVVYTVRILTNAPWMSKPEYSVLRRYSDFRWLHAAMVHNHPGVVVPPIPEKVKVGRFAPELVEFRRRSLERALLKMLEHPMLQQDEDLKLFLESANLTADIHERDLRKGPVVTPEYKTYFGWSQALHQYRFHDPSDWFARQMNYLEQFEIRMKEIVESLSALAQKRTKLAGAYMQLYHSLVALSSSGLSRSVSTGFAALADMKRRSAKACTALADHEANVFSLVLYEYERLVGSIRKAFQSREEVWQAWQHAGDELTRVRSKYAKPNDSHIDSQNHALTHAQIAHAALHTRFEEVTRLCKLEVDRFEREKVAEIRAAFEAYVQAFRAAQADVLDEWQHCETIVQRIVDKSQEKVCWANFFVSPKRFFMIASAVTHMLDYRICMMDDFWNDGS